MDWEEKRREEIFNAVFDEQKLYIKDKVLNKIIQQEKQMLREFAKDCIKGYAGIAAITARNHINKILQSKGIEEI